MKDSNPRSRHRAAVGRAGPPADAVTRVRAEVEHRLRQAGVAPGETLVLAVSGGLDSAVLLDAVDHLKDSVGLRLHVAHYDHRLRPDSGDDAESVAAAAAGRGLPCSRGSGDVADEARRQHRSVEDVARTLRYRFLESVAAQVGARWIALGHQAGDQAETVLLRLLRGSGARGLGGMEAVRQGRYLRPLLGLERGLLDSYASTRGLPVREDASNRSLDYQRNRVRHELIPYLREHFNPNLVEVLGRTAALLRDDDGCLDELARTALRTVSCALRPDRVVLAAPRLLDYHISIQRRVIRLVLEGPGPGGVSVGFDHVEGVLEVLRRPGSPVYAPGSGWRVQRVGDELYLRRGALPAVEVEVQAPGHTSVPERGLDLVAEVLPADRFPQVRPGLGGYRAAFDADRAAAPIRLRSWRPGDRIQPLGMAGRKKLSDLLVDARWPRLLRDEVLVLTCGEGIAWVAGVQSAHPFRVRDDTRRVLVMQLVRGGV